MGFKKGLVLGSILLLSPLSAADWEDLLAAIKAEAQKYEFIDDGQYHEGKLYNALVVYRVINGNNNRELDPNEKVYVKVRGINGLVLETPEDGLTEDGLKSWAEQHANSLIEAVFGGDPAQTVSGNAPAINSIVNVATSLSTTTSSINYVYEIPSSSTKSVETTTTVEISGGSSSSSGSSKSTSSASYQSSEKQKEESSSKNQKKRYLEYYTYSSYTLLDSEKAKITNNGYSGNSLAGIFTYSKSLSDRNSLGISINYRMTDLDDPWDSKSKSLYVSPFWRHRFAPQRRISYALTLYASAGLLYLKSKAFPDGAGYFEYGGGVLFEPTVKLDRRAKYNWNFLLGYQYSKKYVPPSLVPDDLKFLADAINDLPAMHIGSAGTSLSFKPFKHLKGELGTLYVKVLNDAGLEDGRDKALYSYGKVYLIFGKLTFALGYKVVSEVKNYDEKAYMASIKYNF